MPQALIARDAPAKINLTLQILGRRPDGYHALRSLVAFAGHGDRLALEPGLPLSLETTGPFADDLDPNDNLVLKAAQLAVEAEPGLTLGRFRLEKNLPVASGLGGGSADAATALRLIASANDGRPDETRLGAIADRLGSDIRVCLHARSAWMQGRGEIVSPGPTLPPVWAVLANPGVSIATADVFSALTATKLAGVAHAEPPGAFADADALVEFMRGAPNDLERPARAITPVIGEVLAILAQLPNAMISRLSGSGATCFALFRTEEDAQTAARQLAQIRPRWWVRGTNLC